MHNEKYSIYKHTTPDGKVYIGITSKNPESRWGVNGVNYKNQFFYKAIEKFGWNNISHEVIATNIDRVYAECFEKALIQMYDSTDKNNGYNISKGGLNIETDRFFMFYYDFKLDLSPQNIVRFLMICSYAAYDTNFLRYNNGIYINSKSLKTILKLSNSSYKSFIKEIIYKGYLIKESGKFKINADIISKGNVCPGRKYIKIYNECYISFYNSLNPRQHKLVGYFISNIKHLNIKYNILCNNIHECNLESIDNIGLKEVCIKSDLSFDNLKRLYDDICNISFKIYNEDQNIIKISRDRKRIIYNPYVFYNGNNADRDFSCSFFNQIK